MRKEVGVLPTILVVAAAVFVMILAKPPMRVLAISLLGGVYCGSLVWLNAYYESKRKSNDPPANPLGPIR